MANCKDYRCAVRRRTLFVLELFEFIYEYIRVVPICLNTVATRCHILKLKCTKFDFGWGSAPDPAGQLIALP